MTKCTSMDLTHDFLTTATVYTLCYADLQLSTDCSHMGMTVLLKLATYHYFVLSNICRLKAMMYAILAVKMQFYECLFTYVPSKIQHWWMFTYSRNILSPVCTFICCFRMVPHKRCMYMAFNK